MPLGIVMVSVSKSSTFIVSRNGQKLPELMKDGDVQVNSNTWYNFYYYEFDQRDHPYITLAIGWLGGFRKWPFLLMLITVFMLIMLT